MIDDSRKLVFLHPSRTGGLSVERLMFPEAAQTGTFPTPPDHIRFWGATGKDGFAQHYPLDLIGGRPEGYVVFATVRCPYKRAASMKSYAAINFPGESFAELLLNPKPGYRFWTASQTRFTHPHGLPVVDRMIRICDGESEGKDWLLETFDKLPEVSNEAPKVELTDEERRAVRERYPLDFHHYGYPL